ncbi:glycosyltransferase [Rothia koreensis]|uniref:glycosyltransferase n=1 Tax=Rothia koreensis TaxID=592378 RepID=UPI0037C611CF
MQPNSDAGPGDTPSPRVVAVVVTYNRLRLLRTTLSGIAGGRVVPDQVVLVDNASTDGTPEFLDELDYSLPIDVVRLRDNLGGAGGFTVGIDRALAVHDADLVWVMDDDTEPLAETLAESVSAWSSYAEAPEERPAFVASNVVWTDGREHPMNSMIQRIGATPEQKARAAAVGGTTIRSGSFVSLLMDAAAMRRIGLPWADYFIWNDDFEYSTRLARFRDAVSLPASVVVHHTKTFGTTDADPGPRFYNDVRNKLWVFTRSQSLAPWEKILYAGATGRLWLRTFRNSEDRTAVLRYLSQGVRDALRGPRSNEEVLGGSYDLRNHAAPHGSSDADPVHGVEPTRKNKPELEHEGFSLLMPVYHGDTPDGLRRAISSNVHEQTLPPAEVVLVVDGPVDPDLEEIVREAVRGIEQKGIAVSVKRLGRNGGLANALNVGLKLCSYRVVARADADDESLPERFETLVPSVRDGRFHAVGSAMFEMDESFSEIQSVREVQTGSEQIRRIAALRNPLCHPTVVFDSEAVGAVGGYEPIPGAEDYGLWARMLEAGYAVGNVAEPLVKYRAGHASWDRRGGWGAARRELVLQRHLRASGFIGPVRWASNVVVRGGYRLVPRSVRIGAYRALIGSRGSRDTEGADGPSHGPSRESRTSRGAHDPRQEGSHLE